MRPQGIKKEPDCRAPFMVGASRMALQGNGLRFRAYFLTWDGCFEGVFFSGTFPT